MESVPKETETIAHKKALRISEKIRLAREKLALKNAWWTSEFVEIASLLMLLVTNFVLIMPLIGQPSTSLKFSGPIVPLFAKAISLFGPPFAYSVQLVNAIFFLSLPVTFYYFVKFVSGRKFSAFLSALIISLPFALLAKTRIAYGFTSADSPFIASLAILPVVLITLLKFLRAGGIKNLVISSIVTAFLGLVSPFGIFVFLIISVVTTFSEILLGEGRIKILRLFTIYFFAAGLTSFWYNPGLFWWMVTGTWGEEIRVMLGRVIPISFFVVPVFASIGYLLFDRKPGLQPFFLALFYTLAFLVIVIMGGGFIPSHPGRYIPILGLSLAFLIGVATLMGYEHFHFTKVSRYIPIKGTKDALLIFVALGLIILTIGNRGQAVNSNSDVLGVWTDVQKGDIWIARDKLSVKNSIPGYFISLSAAGFLFFFVSQKAVFLIY